MDGAWRCFHCDETFTDRDAAALHFGTHWHQHPGCTIDLAAYRDMEALQLRYLGEDSDVQREMRRMESEHAQALRRAEEAGYAKGLKDAEVAAPATHQGYVDAFYEIGKRLDIGARVESPKWVFENVMLPKLNALMGTRPDGGFYD